MHFPTIWRPRNSKFSTQRFPFGVTVTKIRQSITIFLTQSLLKKRPQLKVLENIPHFHGKLL